ncbi:hypothetical protein BamMEX5DRAFT_1565 [Burkholderia ambifaria MEX-5]|uniref:Uncharacterized protein n=1 Tax=Burkholderia ambifaria MEX-5 TaxID=396597 RepID=B1T199_9BURK|nr:hypothetical protein BamMEX5DRAFT_1565 [Burkholderia ambifaria MEX-5]
MAVAVLGARDVVAEHAFVRQQVGVERDLQRAGEQQVGRGEAVADEPAAVGERLRECTLHTRDVAPAERDRIARRTGEFLGHRRFEAGGCEEHPLQEAAAQRIVGRDAEPGARAAIGEIEQHRARFGERLAAVVERGQLGHRIDLDERVAPLFVRTQVDRHELVDGADFLQHPQRPECPGFWPVVELHRASALDVRAGSVDAQAYPSGRGSDRGGRCKRRIMARRRPAARGFEPLRMGQNFPRSPIRR